MNAAEKKGTHEELNKTCLHLFSLPVPFGEAILMVQCLGSGHPALLALISASLPLPGVQMVSEGMAAVLASLLFLSAGELLLDRPTRNGLFVELSRSPRALFETSFVTYLSSLRVMVPNVFSVSTPRRHEREVGTTVKGTT